jgi:uncharacterized protein (TIGR03437 family)
MRSTAVAPGEMVTLFGRGIGPDAGVFSPVLSGSGTLPSELGGTQVSFDGVAAPLVYAQANQVNAIVPFEMAGRESADIQISFNGQMTDPATVSIVDAQPGIFTNGGAATGQAIALNEDASFNSTSNPAAKGSIVSVFATGAGQTDPPGMNGSFASDDSIRPILPVSVLIGGIGAEVIRAGVPEGAFAGLLLVEVRVPEGTASGPDVSVEVAIGETLSPPATLAIR